MKIHEIFHPSYVCNVSKWLKWRLTYRGGEDFINTYLKKFSDRETDADYSRRRQTSYCPAFAKAAINDIKNAIFQRINDVSRVGGAGSFQTAVAGDMGGVDRLGSSMASFIGEQILPELLSMQSVGVYVDMPAAVGSSRADDSAIPYAYTYRVEQILSWAFAGPGNPSEFSSLLLKDEIDVVDKTTGLPTGKETRFRHLYLVQTENGQRVAVRFYNVKGESISVAKILQINAIPFSWPKLSVGLLEDAADYQIALLNLASSDLLYALKSNYPFYTEQYDPRAASKHHTIEPLPEQAATVQAIQSTPTTTEKETVETGVGQGRRYPIGAERPGFISPSAEPLRVSIEKQEKLKEEIRLLVNLALSNLTRATASTDSKMFDERGLEAGLSYIGLVLQRCENQISQYWHSYLREPATKIIYPKKYHLTETAEDVEADKHLLKLGLAVSSPVFKKRVAKILVERNVGHRVTSDELKQIASELDKTETALVDSEIIDKDVDAGVLAPDDAARLRGYPADTSEKAQKYHTERLIRIQQAQGGSSSGIKDLNADGASKTQKDGSQSSTTGGQTRGEA